MSLGDCVIFQKSSEKKKISNSKRKRQSSLTKADNNEVGPYVHIWCWAIPNSRYGSTRVFAKLLKSSISRTSTVSQPQTTVTNAKCAQNLIENNFRKPIAIRATRAHIRVAAAEVRRVAKPDPGECIGV